MKRATPLRPGDAAWLTALGEAARAIGSDEFPARLLHLFARLIRHDMAMVVRYARFSAPDFLVCEGFPDHQIETYRTGWYRFDPFYGYWHRRERGGVVGFRDVAPPTLLRSGYRAFQRQAKICDELGMFLPGVGRGSIALFLERSKGWFTTAEKQRARRAIQPSPASTALTSATSSRPRQQPGRALAAADAGDPAARSRRRARLRQQGMARGRGRFPPSAAPSPSWRTNGAGRCGSPTIACSTWRRWSRTSRWRLQAAST
jgi:hypothetical protein